MNESNYQKLVAFHLAADGSVPPAPTVPQAEILSVRRTLIREEYEEVMAAFGEVDGVENGRSPQALTELAHELADLLYVVYGTFAACGIDADAVFSEVHSANMRKMGGPRRADGKLLKPPDWQPANVGQVLVDLQIE
ncbi:MAG: hypothetical protein GY796_30925 [Chloroflexi bacterium]|nr:hypothetical protein [Chloroflexota bacterium]